MKIYFFFILLLLSACGELEPDPDDPCKTKKHLLYNTDKAEFDCRSGSPERPQRQPVPDNRK